MDVCGGEEICGKDGELGAAVSEAACIVVGFSSFQTLIDFNKVTTGYIRCLPITLLAFSYPAPLKPKQLLSSCLVGEWSQVLMHLEIMVKVAKIFVLLAVEVKTTNARDIIDHIHIARHCVEGLNSFYCYMFSSSEERFFFLISTIRLDKTGKFFLAIPVKKKCVFLLNVTLKDLEE
ncbi:hypothetical protein STEG23_010208 [Scotinomys teguina]